MFRNLTRHWRTVFQRNNSPKKKCHRRAGRFTLIILFRNPFTCRLRNDMPCNLENCSHKLNSSIPSPRNPLKTINRTASRTCPDTQVASPVASNWTLRSGGASYRNDVKILSIIKDRAITVSISDKSAPSMRRRFQGQMMSYRAVNLAASF